MPKETKNVLERRKRRMEQFLKALDASGGHIANACKGVGVDRSQIYEWMKKDPEFKLALNKVRDEKTDNVEAALYKNALEGDTTAQIFYLKTIGRERGYAERIQIEDVTEVDFTEA